MFCPNLVLPKVDFYTQFVMILVGANEFKKCEENYIDNEIWIV
jgi:hypothetical protein